MTGEQKKRLMDQLVAGMLGALIATAINVFVVMRRLDALEAQLTERHIAQVARDQEQERRLNNMEAILYTVPRRTR